MNEIILKTRKREKRLSIEEKAKIKELLSEGKYTIKDISLIMNRRLETIKAVVKKYNKEMGLYNREHIDKKYAANELFLEHIHPTSVLDVYCGTNRYYLGKCEHVVTNDINSNIEADYHMDAAKLLEIIDKDNKEFDLVDIDPFGNPAACIDSAIKIATKGVVFTFGEFGNVRRFKSEKVVQKLYGMNLRDYDIDNIIAFVQRAGRHYGKELIPYEIHRWTHILRVYFEIQSIEKELIIS